MQEGFFDIKPIKPDAKTMGATCEACGLYREVLTPKMQPFGNFKLGIMNIGEAPGETEDRRGKQWQGKVGQSLQKAYRSLGIDLFEDCINVNSINCRPTEKGAGNRAPTPQEIACCRPRVLKAIETYKPRVIVLLGEKAVLSVIGPRWKSDLGKIGKWRGWQIPDRDLNAWLCATYHPSFVERSDSETRAVRTIWMQDLAQALRLHKVELPLFGDELEQIEIVKDLSFLDEIRGPAAVDFETTGLKPHDLTRHKIICAAVCDSPTKARAFMVDGNDVSLLRKFLASRIPKIAANLKFEHTWAHNVLDVEVQGWIWDTMLATHVLDNRPDITGLKFQVYVNFGVVDYASEVSQFLKSKDSKNGNDVNQIEALVQSLVGRKKLLKYCGLDALFEFKLAMKQMEALK